MCIESLVVTGICPDEGTPTSGFSLLQAPGMSIKNFANIATETYKTGLALALEKKTYTASQLKNDLIGELQRNKVIAQVPIVEFNTATFNPTKSMGTYAGYRGTIVNKNLSWKGSLRKTKIKAIELYPLASGNTTIKITDGYTIYSYPVEVVANQINVFDATQLDGFPFVMQNKTVQVYVDSTNIAFASTEIACKTGCGGSMPNPCGHAEGWNGTGYVKAEGYGVNVIFYCECDYENIICSNPALFGELFLIKWQINIFEEQYLSNRFDNWVVYNRETINKEVLPKLYGEYSEKWGNLMSGLKGILSTYRDGCLDCQNSRWVTNV